MTTLPDIERIMSNARVHMPGVLDNALKLELFNVMDEFFSNTNCWQEDVTFKVRAGDDSYELDLEADAVPNRLMGVTNLNGIRVHATMQEPEIIVLGRAPDTDGELIATVALTVRATDNDDFPQCPSWVVRKYKDGLVAGLLGRMMSQPAKPYTSERLAIFHTRRFRGVMALARSEARHMNLYGAQRWAFPQNFAKGSGRF
jgi:hypothetical protein